MRTRSSACRRKKRFGSDAEATAAALRATIDLRPYRCDRCGTYHLTSRTKSKRPLPRGDRSGATSGPDGSRSS